MKHSFSLTALRVLGFVATLCIWLAVQGASYSQSTSFIVTCGAVVLVFPTVWVARKMVDSSPTSERVLWVTSVVHIIMMMLLGGSVIEAIKLFQALRGLSLPLPAEIGTVLLWIFGPLTFLTVLNLAVSGWGAPFAVALSRRLADRWLYHWTRNPMVLGSLAMLVSGGLYLQSLYFIFWAVLLVTPAMIYYLKVYEERELELRFGAPYLEYKAKTSFLWPRKPRD
jgi:protein-S-isoprenylcysteine O-methyltransferase Ste14